MAIMEIHVPDIGDFKDIPVIEIPVSPGDRVSAEDPVVTLESDKATMDVPAPADGVVVSLAVAVGDTVSEGTLVATLETDVASSDEDGEAPEPPAASEPPPGAEAPAAATPASGTPSVVEVTVPDIGDFKDIPVIEIAVSPGDRVSAEDPLVTLESDKATMDVPAPCDGIVRELKVSVGDTVSEGTLVVVMESAGSSEAPSAPASASPPAAPAAAAPAAAAPDSGSSGPTVIEAPAPATAPRPAPTASMAPSDDTKRAHATPAVRRFARELGVDLTRVSGTGRKGRVRKDDVTQWVKRQLEAPAGAAPGGVQGGMGIPPIPEVDFSKFGEVEVQPMSRIQRLSGPHLHRAWLNVPHVTHHDEADITELEAFRKSLKDEAASQGKRITVLSFIMKAVVAGLKAFPNFNASLAPDAKSLILKRYYNVGVAVDTPDGLVVPVIRGVDEKSIYELAGELAEASARARDGKLTPTDLSGGCISISSLGGIGGTAFTPIVNAPEVAILGVTRARMQPVWDGKAFAPRLMVPLDLSYDHRVIDGASAARFVAHLAASLGDVRRLLL